MNDASRSDLFYDRDLRFGGASDFAADMKGLSIPNMKALGHRFRMIQHDPGAAKAERERGSAEPESIPERIVRAPNFLPAVFLEQGAFRARAVCKIETDGRGFDGVQGKWNGTGFLVCSTILLTNHHVINSIATARNALCIFNYQLGPDGKPAETLAVRLDPSALFVTSPWKDGLDYTFIAIDPAAARQFGCIPMVRSAFTIHPGDNANIVQHPEGRQKEVVLQENEVMRDTGVLLHYASDTLGGSSGSPVFNNRWQLIALHHASKPNDDQVRASPDAPVPDFLNEGIKLSAIATDLERRAQTPLEATSARAVLAAFEGVDSLGGFFGTMGRSARTNGDEAQGAVAGAAPVPQAGTSGERSGVRLAAVGVERVEDAYSGEGEDLDVAFWNTEWFAKGWHEKVDLVTQTVADLNLDVWALAQSSMEAAEAVVMRLRQDYQLQFACASCAPLVPAALPSTTLIWNTKTVACQRLDWPEEIDGWFQVHSQQFPDLRLEAVHGKVFDDYPGLFHITSLNRPYGMAPFDILLVPLHLKQNGEGSARRRMAGKILAAAVNHVIEQHGDGPGVLPGAGGDWIIGGDFNAEFATTDFRTLSPGRLVPLAAQDAQHGAMMYLKSPHSLIDHVFLSKNLGRRFGAEDFFIVAIEQELPDYLPKLSDHRPVLVRLSLVDAPPVAEALPASLAEALRLG